MKIFHTADWHLGKIVLGTHLTEDQRDVLQQFVHAVQQEKPDVVIIAGDIYDRAIPPVEAIKLYDELITSLAFDLQIPVLAISGNHDSPERLQFASKFMHNNNYYIQGSFDPALTPITLYDEFGKVHFYLVPYVEPKIVQLLFEDDSIRTHNDAMRAISEKIKEQANIEERHILIGHAFFTPTGEADDAVKSDSERPLSIGGSEYISTNHVSWFNYVALGHLHQAHQVGAPHIRYAGSPLKYSLSEKFHQKGYLIIELDEQGQVTVEKKELYPTRDLRQVVGSMEEILQLPKSEDYVFVTLTDEHVITQPMEKVRTVFPNAMHVERQLLHHSSLQNNEQEYQIKELSDSEKFAGFYSQVMDCKWTTEQQMKWESLFNDFIEKERLK